MLSPFPLTSYSVIWRMRTLVCVDAVGMMGVNWIGSKQVSDPEKQ